MKGKRVVLVCLGAAFMALTALAATPGSTPKKNEVLYPVGTAVTPALRSIAPDTCGMLAPSEHRVIPNRGVTKDMKATPKAGGPKDALLRQVQPAAPMPNPLINFDGINNIEGVVPPDTEGDIGPNHYVQWINSHIQGWTIDRNAWTATTAFGPVAGNTLWAPLGGPCAADNWGDPIVLWDRFRNRWVISQFDLGPSANGPYKVAIAVSQTSDPSGAWWLYCYDYSASVMNDYPKFGIWPDGYYMTCNQFAPSWDGAGVAVFEADKMINGDPTARMLKLDLSTISLNYGNILPGNFEGMIDPPAGSPDCLVEVDDSSWWSPALPSDMISIWKVAVDWTSGTMTVGSGGDPSLQIPISDFTPLCIGTRSCIPQPAGGENLDAIGDRAMYRCAYRNNGDYQSMVFNITVDAGSGRAGIRWFELRKDSTHADWYLYQEGTYAPSDTINRWMASAAQDHMGNIAVGYSMSDSSTKPSIGYAGRLAGDPAGTLPQSEVILFNGLGVQNTGYNRWGDYSAMSVDPTDDCTFWYTQEYIAASGGWDWRTRIGAFKFANCSMGPTGTLSGVVTAASGGAPIGGATVSATDGGTTINGQTAPDGTYSLTLPVGTYDVTASAFGYAPATATSLGITDGGTTTQNFSLTSALSHVVSGTVTDASTSWPLYASIHITGDMGYPGTTIYTNPADGTYSITLVDGVTYSFTVTPWVAGYTPGTASVGPLSADTTQDFALSVTSACVAPGYVITGGMVEHFESWPPPGWTITSNVGGGLTWNLDSAYGDSNYTGGTGHAATVDSNNVGQTPYDTELRTPAMDFTTFTGYSLTYLMNFQVYSGDEALDVDISTDGGSTWTNLRHYTTDQGTLYGTPGVSDTVDLSSYAADTNVMLRWRYYTSDSSPWDWYAQIDDVSIGTPQCTAPAGGGLIFGNVYDGNTGNAIAGASVANAATSETVNTAATPDPNVDDGFYCMYGVDGTQTLTASKNLYGSNAQSPTVPHYGAVQQDFHLASGHLGATPASLEITLQPDSTGSQTLTLQNVGGAPVNWTVGELLGHVSRPSGNLFARKLSTPNLTKTQFMTRAFMEEMSEERAERKGEKVKDRVAEIAEEAQAKSMGRAPKVRPPLTSHTAVKPLGKLLPAGVTAYGINLYPGNGDLETFDSSTPGTWTTIGSTGRSLFAGDFLMGDFTKLYCLDYDTNQLVTVDTATSAVTVIGSATPISGDSWCGMACSNTGVMYASSANSAGTVSTLYTIDPSTGTTTVVGTITNAALIIDIAINPAHDLYGLDLVNNTLVKIDPATGAGTVIGPTGFTANYAQGMAFEPVSGTLYLAAFNYGASQGELRTCDTSTGATTLIGAFPGGAEVDCLAFATFVPSDIPWIDEVPNNGTVPASGNQNVTINYDTTGMASGDYLATLSFSTDTPYGALNVPVTLHVLEPVAATASADHTSGTAPMAVNFSCTASGGIPPYTFDWDFGDATAHSTAQNPSHTYYMGGNFNVVLTVTDSTGHHASDSMTMNVTAPNVEIMTFFLDDFGSCQVCLNRLTGHYQWNVLSGPNAGSYSGTAQVYNNGGIFYSMPGDSNMIYVYYDRVNHKAWGYLYQTGAAYYCQLSDSDTTDDPQVCQTVVTP